MKKLFNYALLAAALLVGVNVNADDVCSVTIGEGQPTNYSSVKAALDAIALDPTPGVATIDMSLNSTETADLFFENERTYVWNFNGNTVTIGSGATCGLHIDHANVTLNGEGTLQASTGMGRHYLVLVHGSTNPNDANYTTVTVDKKLNITTAEKEAYAFDIIYRLEKNGDRVDGGETAAYGVTVNFEDCYVYGYYGAITIIGNLTGDGENRPVVNVSKDAELAAYDQLCTLDDKSKTAVAEHFSLKWYGDKKHLNEPDVLAQKDSYRESSSAIYGAGVATWNIKGYVHGGNGLYIKGGKVVLNDATVAATAPEYHEPIVSSNGYMACGSAIVLDSNENYGDLDGVTITGESEISSTSGWGIEEVATAGGTKVPDIVIESGTISGVAGSISTTAEVKDNVALTGTITGGVFSDTKIQDYLPQIDGVIVPHTDPETGVTTYSVETIPGGIEAARLNDIHGDVADKDVAIAEGKNEVIADNEDITCQSLIVEEGATLTINGKLTVAGLNIAGKVTVAQKGTLIVKEKGVVCFNAQDFVIEAAEGAMGKFLLDPDVPGNTHPTATVQLFSKACNLTTWQRFGVPAFEGITTQNMSWPQGVTAYLFQWNNTKNDWEQIKSTSTVLRAFQGLTLTDNSASGTTYNFYCNLVGNVNGNINLLTGWNSFANSYMADADILSIIHDIATNHEDEVDLGMYVYKIEDGTWADVSLEDLGEDEALFTSINPMQGFVLRAMAPVDEEINYRTSVWNNAGGNHAPRVAQFADNLNKVVISLTDENNNTRRLTIRESAQYTNDYDNGADMQMYNEGLGIYASTQVGNLCQVATNDIEGQIITIATKETTSFTMSFSNVRGEKMAIRDNMTGDVIEMAEGVTYNFMANANEVSERFTIIAAAKAPTALKKAEAAVKAAKFIRHDQVILQNNGRLFNVLGAEVK